MQPIKINGITYDPRETSPVARAAAPIAPDAAKSNYILIQTRAPLSPAQGNWKTRPSVFTSTSRRTRTCADTSQPISAPL
jgi:hypothetical protein